MTSAFRPIYVIGGRQRKERSLRELGDGWYGYDTGVIVRVDPSAIGAPTVTVVKEYVSRPGTHVDGDAVLFKSGTHEKVGAAFARQGPRPASSSPGASRGPTCARAAISRRTK